jgi:hypothetical protein
MREQRIAGTYCNPGIAVGTWLERLCIYTLQAIQVNTCVGL